MIVENLQIQSDIENFLSLEIQKFQKEKLTQSKIKVYFNEKQVIIDMYAEEKNSYLFGFYSKSDNIYIESWVIDINLEDNSSVPLYNQFRVRDIWKNYNL